MPFGSNGLRQSKPAKNPRRFVFRPFRPWTAMPWGCYRAGGLGSKALPGEAGKPGQLRPRRCCLLRSTRRDILRGSQPGLADVNPQLANEEKMAAPATSSAFRPTGLRAGRAKRFGGQRIHLRKRIPGGTQRLQFT